MCVPLPLEYLQRHESVVGIPSLQPIHYTTDYIRTGAKCAATCVAESQRGVMEERRKLIHAFRHCLCFPFFYRRLSAQHATKSQENIIQNKTPMHKKHSYRKQTHTDSTQLAGRDTGNEPHLHLAINSDLVDLSRLGLLHDLSVFGDRILDWHLRIYKT